MYMGGRTPQLLVSAVLDNFRMNSKASKQQGVQDLQKYLKLSMGNTFISPAQTDWGFIFIFPHTSKYPIALLFSNLMRRAQRPHFFRSFSKRGSFGVWFLTLPAFPICTAYKLDLFLEGVPEISTYHFAGLVFSEKYRPDRQAAHFQSPGNAEKRQPRQRFTVLMNSSHLILLLKISSSLDVECSEYGT